MYLSVLIGLVTWFLLKHTRLGITLRSVGENPKAAESQGIPVNRVKYLAVLTGGGLAGMARGLPVHGLQRFLERGGFQPEEAGLSSHWTIFSL